MLDLFDGLGDSVQKSIGKVVKKQIYIILAFFLAIHASLLFTETNASYMSRVIWGIGSGPVFETGTLRDELATGVNLHLSTWWPLPGKFQDFFIVSSFGWDHFPLADSSESALYSIYINAGFGYRYYFSRYFQPFGALGIHGSFLHVDARRLNEEENSFKPGLTVEAGIMSEIYYGFGLNIGLTGKFEPVSSSLYSPLTFKISATYRYGTMHTDRNGSRQAINLSEEIARVNNALKEKDIAKAEKLAGKLYRKFPDEKEVQTLNREVSSIRENYKKGKSLYAGGKYLEALPFLSKSSLYYDDALEKADDIRKQYSGRIKNWERQGVRAYEQRKYDACIAIMKRILQVEPKNRIAGIYLPRARKRKQALKSFE